jgi:hypothetical protein
MKGYSKAVILIILLLAVLTPLASIFPDGLETVAENLRIEGIEPAWHGLMPGYTFPIIQNPQISTFLSGTLGTLLVLATAFIVGKAVSKTAERKTANH